MAIVLTDDKHYKNIANSLRTACGDDEYTYRPQDMAKAVLDTYSYGYQDGYELGEESGWNSGYDEGYDTGYSEGSTSEHETFWNSFQQEGNRVNYRYAFYGLGWTDANFNPLYELKPTIAASMFQGCRATDSTNMTLDMSNVTDATSMFQSCHFTSLDLNLADATYNKANMFRQAVSLNTLSLGVNENTTFNNTMFLQDGMVSPIRNLNIEGNIRNNGLDLHEHPNLNVASLRSILRALLTEYDEENESWVPLNKTGLSITLATRHQTVIEADATCMEYLQVATSLGWTIAYL